VTLRSDELRKRLWRHPSREPLPKAAYAPEETERTYTHMFALGGCILSAGQAVVFDATFREASFRSSAESVAAMNNVSFDGLWLSVPAEARARRVAARAGDVSDATASIALAQAEIDPASITWQIAVEDFANADTVPGDGKAS
jgi:predicted kinase